MSSASILVVDDDTSFREALCRVLRTAGYAVEEAADGAEALRIVAADTPDLLITDLIMPNRDGVELVIAVRRDYPAVRILVISGRQFGALDLLNVTARLGADATLAKPFATDQLMAKINELLGLDKD